MVRLSRPHHAAGAAALLLSLCLSTVAPAQYGSPVSSPQRTDRPLDSSPSSWVTVCKVYPLENWGANAELASWLAETIPQMVAPGSWSSAPNGGRLSYYAPGKVLVISHNAAVHTQVEAFLTQIKGTTSAAPVEPSTNVVPATFSMLQPVMKMVGQQAQDHPRTPSMMPRGGSDRPKHRFHFSILYEGEGLVDDNVVDLIRAQSGVPSVPIQINPAPTCCANPGVMPAAATLPSSVYLEPAPQYSSAPLCAPASYPPALSGPAAPVPAPWTPASPAPAKPQPAAPKMPRADSR